MARIVSYKSATQPMQGASANNSGAAGFIPAPAASSANAYLRGDGTWSTGTYTVSNVVTFVNPGSFYYTPSSNLLYAVVECIGGGGAGGSAIAGTNGSFASSGGGGGGQYAKSMFSKQQLGSMVPVTIGAGGTPGINDGQNTIFGAVDEPLVLASGGSNAQPCTASSMPISCTGGSGGGDASSSGLGEMLVTGSNGEGGIALDSNNMIGGYGGQSAFGYTFYGAGGNGVIYSYHNDGATSVTGIIGNSGACIVTEYLITDSGGS